MSKSIRPLVTTESLRAIADDKEAAGHDQIQVAELLRILDLEERLIDTLLRVMDAKGAVRRGDLNRATWHLELVEADLNRLVDFV